MIDKSLLIIPTYQEKDNISQMITAVFSAYPEIEILVVDDNSPDQTAAIVRSLQPIFPQLHLLVREKKAGLGAAYLAGFAWGLEREYHFLLEMDADFSHPIDKIGLLIATAHNNQGVAIGSRYVQGGDIKGWDAKRVLLSKGAALYVWLILGMPVADPTAGFICYHRKVLESIPFEKIRWMGYGFQIAMKYFAYRLGFTLTEIPIAFVDRVAGKSKMSMAIFKEALLGVWELRKVVLGLLFALFISCTQPEQEPLISQDPNVLPMEKMIDVLTQVHLLEEYAKEYLYKDTSLGEYTKDQRLIWGYEGIFEKYQIKSDDFEQSFAFYSQDPYTMQNIYTAVQEKIIILAIEKEPEVAPETEN